jgi:hypothetical protein
MHSVLFIIKTITLFIGISMSMSMNMDTNTYMMFVVGLVAGLMSTMNVWANSFSDIRFHLNDVYMIVLMTCWMILLMFLLMLVYDSYMKTGHKNDSYGLNLIIPAIIILVSFCFIREQTFIDDKQFLKGMIPHHSMAILMAKKIKDKTKNNKIRRFADNIIHQQQTEINEMKMLEQELV